MSKDSLTITDNRTGKSYEIAIENGAIKALDLRQIKAGDDTGLMTYDPGFTNTAACKSRITFIDGDKGILNYRGYPIEQLAGEEHVSERLGLLLQGGCRPAQQESWVYGVTHPRWSREHQEAGLGFRYDAHPMGVLMSTVAALCDLLSEANTSTTRRCGEADLPAHREDADPGRARHRHSMGLPFVYPDNDLGYPRTSSR